MEALPHWQTLYSQNRPLELEVFVRPKGRHSHTTKMGGQVFKYDFVIEYKKGNENRATYYLFRQFEERKVTLTATFFTHHHMIGGV